MLILLLLLSGQTSADASLLPECAPEDWKSVDFGGCAESIRQTGSALEREAGGFHEELISACGTRLRWKERLGERESELPSCRNQKEAREREDCRPTKKQTDRLAKKEQARRAEAESLRRETGRDRVLRLGVEIHVLRERVEKLYAHARQILESPGNCPKAVAQLLSQLLYLKELLENLENRASRIP